MQIAFGITTQMTLERFLPQKSKRCTKLTAQVTNITLTTKFLLSVLLTALEYLERKAFRLVQVIPTAIGRGLEKL